MQTIDKLLHCNIVERRLRQNKIEGGKTEKWREKQNVQGFKFNVWYWKVEAKAKEDWLPDFCQVINEALSFDLLRTIDKTRPRRGQTAITPGETRGK